MSSGGYIPSTKLYIISHCFFSHKLHNYYQVLRHDKAVIHPIRQKVHLRAIPSYLVPNSMKAVAQIQTTGKKRKSKSKGGQSTESRIMKSKRNDPLNQPIDNDEDGGAGYNDTEGNEDGEGDQIDDNYENDIDDNEYTSHEAVDQDDGNSRVYTSKEVSNLGRTISGRKEWQLRHKKGQYNEKHLKKLAHRTPGTWSKSKVIK